MRHLLGIAGSLRRSSYNRLLLEAAREGAPSGLELAVYDQLASIPMFDEDLERATAGGPDGVRRLRELVASADGLLIATPEYNWSMPGVLKNVIDWLSRPAPAEVLAGKPVAIVGVSSGRWGTRLSQAALRQVLCATESQVMAQPALFVRDAAEHFDAQGSLRDDALRGQLNGVLAAFAEWIERVAPAGRA